MVCRQAHLFIPIYKYLLHNPVSIMATHRNQFDSIIAIQQIKSSIYNGGSIILMFGHAEVVLSHSTGCLLDRGDNMFGHRYGTVQEFLRGHVKSPRLIVETVAPDSLARPVTGTHMPRRGELRIVTPQIHSASS